MIYAGWGMKNKLLGNPDLWLCHQCGDCSTRCPRGVNPGEVLAATRELSYRSYATPGFFGKMLSRPVLLPMALIIPVIVIAAIIFLAGTLEIPDGPVNYSRFFPHSWLNASFTLLTLLSYSFATIGFRRFWNDLQNSGLGETSRKRGFFTSFWKVKNDILAHNRFTKCESNRGRQVAHFLVFYGFVLLLIVTLYAIYAAITERYPLELDNPFKILGNLSSLMLFSGIGIMIYMRIAKKEGSEKSSYSDWLFLVALLLLTFSGVVVEAARFLNWSAAYYLYFFHLVCVWFVIIYLPHTKFGHVIYRTLAMTFAFSINRK